MKRKLIIDGNAVYEIDEDCMVRQCLREPDTSMEKMDDDIQKEQNVKRNKISNSIGK